MKTELITISSSGAGMSEALTMTEKLGSEKGLDKKPVLHLRLLSEELFGMLRGIAGDVKAEYWIETEGKSFELHMKSDIKMTDEAKSQLLAASSSGKNSAAIGFMGRIKVMIADFLLASSEVMPYAMMNTASAYPMGNALNSTSSAWSLIDYKTDVKKHLDDSKEASEAWDELEKSIVANVADDVKVKIVGKNVEIIVCKAF